MKLALDDSYIKANEAAIKALLEDNLNDMEICVIDDNAYTYYVLNTNGEFQPDDASGNNGWWVKSGFERIRRLLEEVADGYDFPGNNKTDYSSISNWIAYCNCRFGGKYLRDMLIDNYLSGWGALSTPDKKLLVELWVWPQGTTDTALDLLYAKSERLEFIYYMVEKHTSESITIVKSTTASSENWISCTIDDSLVMTRMILTAWNKIY